MIDQLHEFVERLDKLNRNETADALRICELLGSQHATRASERVIWRDLAKVLRANLRRFTNAGG